MTNLSKDLYNKLLARLVLNHRMVDREKLQTCWREVTPEKDLGQIMIEYDVLDFQNYLRLHNYILKLAKLPNFREKAQEILGQQTQSRPAPAQAPAAPSTPRPPETATPEPVPVTDPEPVVERESAPRVEREDNEMPLPVDFRGNSGLGQLSLSIPRTLSANNTLDEMLLNARQVGASDIMLSPDKPILLRRFGQLVPANQDPLSEADVARVVEQGLPADLMDQFRRTGDLEYAYSIEGGGRFRLTVLRQRFGWEVCARVVPLRIRSFEESAMPPSCAELIKWAQGMVLVTGALGSGKSSTLSTLVEMINRTRDDHIITVEQPIEVVFKPKKCQITQREIALHTHSQDSALRAALRQDPDIIVISELRDINSISLAISAAETGHLVLATMNTSNANRTVDRLVDAFPPDEQDAIRSMISGTLRGVISQQLIPRVDGKGLVPAYEVLVVTKAISNLIRKNNTHQLASAMVSGRNSGMVLLDESLNDLLKQGIITGEEAFFRATNPKRFQQYAPSALKELTNG